jgi:hypothetical protein
MFQRGQIPFRAPSVVDVAQGRSDIIQHGIEFRRGHSCIIRGFDPFHQAFWLFLRFAFGSFAVKKTEESDCFDVQQGDR